MIVLPLTFLRVNLILDFGYHVFQHFKYCLLGLFSCLPFCLNGYFYLTDLLFYFFLDLAIG